MDDMNAIRAPLDRDILDAIEKLDNLLGYMASLPGRLERTPVTKSWHCAYMCNLMLLM